MGVVYVSRDLELGRFVAVKTLPRLTSGASQRLRLEARTMAAFTDHSLAQIYGLEPWRGTPMLVVEYLAGGTLAQRLLNARLSTPQACNLGLQLARTLERLLDQGFLHRDMKPSNIGFTVSGVPKLLDFGLAEFVGVDGASKPRVHSDSPTKCAVAPGFGVSLPVPGVAAGTPAYLCPEMLEGGCATPSADLWSLSVVLYEAMTGINPFSVGGYRDTLRRIRLAELNGIRELEAEQPHISAFFRLALARSPGTRFSTAAALATALAGLLDGVTRRPA